jgi:hypothetical protein
MKNLSRVIKNVETITIKELHRLCIALHLLRVRKCWQICTLS